MVKEKRILSYILGWLIVGFIIIFMGVNNVFAASYTVNDFNAQIYDNLGPTLVAKDTIKDSGYFISYGVGYTANSSGAAWGISSPIPLVANHTYSMTVDPYVVGCGSIILSSYNRIGVGTTLSNAVTSYQNNSYVTEKYSNTMIKNRMFLQFVFTPTINSSYIVFPYATSNSCSSAESNLSTVIIEDLGEGSITQDQINTSLTNQTNEINTSINNSTNTITGAITDIEDNINSNIDNMEEAIVESNKETQDVIKDQFNDCRPSENLLPFNNINFSVLGINFYSNEGNLYINGTSTGEILASNQLYLDNLSFTLEPGTYTFSQSKYLAVPISIRLYDDTKTTLASITSNTNKSDTFTITETTKVYVGLYIYNKTFNNVNLELMLNEGSIAKTYEPMKEICSNKIDETNDKLNDIEGALTDTSTPNLDGLENSIGWLPAGPVDSILNLPLTMLNSLTNSLTKTCAPLNLTLPYVNKNIQIPCLSAIFAQITGVNGLWTWVGTISSVLILYNYLLNLYAWVDRVLTLRAEFDEAMGADLANWGRL